MSSESASLEEPLIVGRYALFDELASGGMATVHLGRLLGPVGFSRTVAVKRLHPQFAKDPEFTSAFLDEAKLVARIRHPNVVPTLDVVRAPEGLLLVMEYVHGESLSRLSREAKKLGERVPLNIVASVISSLLLGLHAAHETKDSAGNVLGIVHRDVSPQNVLVGLDGTARVLDFGVAKAAGRAQTTRDGKIKGKLAYMAPEQLQGSVDRRTDVFAAGIVLWELLTGRRLFEGDNDGHILHSVLQAVVSPPTIHVPDLPPALSAVVMKALAKEPDDRFATAREFALALERAAGSIAGPTDVSEWVERLGGTQLVERAQYIELMERASQALTPHQSEPPLFTRDPSGPRLGSNPNISGSNPRASRPSLADLAAEVRSGTTDAGAPLTVTQEPARPKTAIWPMLVAIGILIAGGVGAALLVVFLGKRSTSMPPPVLAAASAPQIVTPDAPSSSAVAMVDPPSTTPKPAVPATSASTKTAQGTKRGTTTPKVTANASSSANAAAAAKAKCDPPFTIDAQGHKHYRPECLQTE